MKVVSLISLLLLLTIQICKSQKLKDGYIRQKKVLSFQQILDLKNGCLLVMLHTNQNKIDALKSIGRNIEADNIERLQSEKNKAIIKTFRSKFDFCPVYFFLNSQALQLIDKGTDSIIFVNDGLYPDSSIRINTQKYFIAEFGVMQEDTAKYFSGYTTTNTDSGMAKTPSYYTSSTYLYQAFIIESNKLIQLRKPFPYFVAITETEMKILLIESVVSKVNRGLKRFEKKARRKITNPRFSSYFKDMVDSEK